MGQAKSRTTHFIEQHPCCCFCGGATPTTSIDHQPAMIIFPDKQRPKGMEYPACDRCNGQTKADEALLGLVSRMAGSFRPSVRPDPHRIAGMISTVNQAYPGLAVRMDGGRALTLYDGRVVLAGRFDVSDPQIDLSFRKVAAKLALAIYFHHTDTIAAPGTLIQTTWEHSQDAYSFKKIEAFLAICPMQSVLKQGVIETEDSFFLRFAYGERQLYIAAIFHESIALLARLFEPSATAGIEHDDFDMGPSWEFGIALIGADGIARAILPASRVTPPAS
jgi:hypothetical protein